MVFVAGLLFAGLVLDGLGVGYVPLCAWGIVTVRYLLPATAVTQDVVHPGQRAIARGMCAFCTCLLGGAYSPWIVGALTDTFGGGDDNIELRVEAVARRGSGLVSMLSAKVSWRQPTPPIPS